MFGSPVGMSDKSFVAPRGILRRSSSFAVLNDGVGHAAPPKAASVSNLSVTSRAIAIPSSGHARSTGSVASGSSASSGDSFSEGKAFIHPSARDRLGLSVESSPDAPGSACDENDDDEAGGRVRRGDALTGLESPLHELLERDRRRDSEHTGGSSGRGGSEFNTMDDAYAFNSIDEVTACDVSPLPTPEVSKHGTNEAWLFMSQSKNQRQQRFSDIGDGESSGPDDSERNVRLSNLDDGSGGSSRGMRRVGSVVSFNDEHKVHDIGSMNDLIEEKKCKNKLSMLSSMKREMKALMVNYGMKTEKPKDAPVIGSLKDSRRNMFDNIDQTIAVNKNRAAWETRELSLRGGNEYQKMMAEMPGSRLAPADTRRSNLSPALDAEGQGE